MKDLRNNCHQSLKGFSSFGIMKDMEDILNKDGFEARYVYSKQDVSIMIELKNGLVAFYDIEILKDMIPFCRKFEKMEI